MASWAEFEEADPDLAAFGRECLDRFGPPGLWLGFLATVRPDGGPRVHPVCPFLCEGRVFVGIPGSSPKRRDLRANPRYMLHSFPYEQDPEFSIRGRARLVTDETERAKAVAAVPYPSGLEDSDDVFELDIDRADSTTWANWAQADTYPVRKKWAE